MTTKKEKADILIHNLDSLLSGESSIELTQTSRGVNWKVKVYHSDPIQALKIANEVYEQCKAKYGNGGTQQ